MENQLTSQSPVLNFQATGRNWTGNMRNWKIVLEPDLRNGMSNSIALDDIEKSVRVYTKICVW